VGVVGGVEAHLDAVRIVEPDEHGSVDLLAASDDEPLAVLDRPWMQQVRTEPDAGKALSLWMGASRDIFARVAPIMRIVRDAAGADPDMAGQWETNRQQRAIAHHQLAEQLADKAGLRPGLSVDRAADI
jgi:hypothetical protein